jgi:DNA-binding HxlR family transcriptional regulator
VTSVVGIQTPVSNLERERCSIVGALDAIGDTWSVLVLRQVFFGVHRFNDIQDGLGISRSVLTDRLNRLVELGVIKTVPYQEPGHRARNEYRMTRKGVGLLPLMVALMQWGDEHVNADNPPVALHHRTTGERVRLELRTDSGPIEPNDIVPRPAPLIS